MNFDHQPRGGEGEGHRTVVLALLALVALLATVLALAPTPISAHPCVKPLEHFGALTGRIVRVDSLHDGNCVTRVYGANRWVATYDFLLNEQTVVQIDLEDISDLDPYLRLLDASGSEIASNDDGGDGYNARIRQTLDRGSYRIEAAQFNAEAGVYRLTVDIANSPQRVGAQNKEQTILSVGGHACGLRESGAVVCWGNNYRGQTNAPSGRFSAVSAGSGHTCGLRETGAVECWGWNDEGQTNAPAGRFSAVSVGGSHSCGLRDTGTVECWGDNQYGQTNAPSGRFSALAQSLGFFHACGVRESGAVECWGVIAGALPGHFSAVSAGWFHICGLRNTGAVECWGDNDDGQRDAPAGRFSAVSAGRAHSCGLRETGAVVCWGDNHFGQASAPAGRFSAVSAGSYHSCGLRDTGVIECWGSSSDGQTDAPSGHFGVPENPREPAEATTQTALPLVFDQAAPRPTWERGRPIAALQLPATQGGQGEVTYRIVSRCGSGFTFGPPDGLEFDAINRVLRGTLSASIAEGGLCTFQLTATDSTGQTTSLDVTADVQMPADFRWLSAVQPQVWTVNDTITPTDLPAATSAVGPVAYSLEWEIAGDAQDGLPSGMSFDALDRRLSGTPTGETGSLSLIYRATEPTGMSIELEIPVELLPTPIVRGQIAVLEREDGRIEIGFQPANGLRILPTRRLFPTDATVGRWYRTGPVEYLGGEIGRVRVRRLADGRVELAFQPTNGEWLYPTGRYLSPNNIGDPHWVNFTAIEMSCPDVCDPDVNNPGVQRYLAEVYAPILRFDRGEEFHPVGIEAMVKNAKMMDATAALAGERFTAEAIWRWNAVGLTWSDGVDGGPWPWPLPSDVAPENTYLSLNVDIGAPALYHNHGRYVNWWKAIRDQYDPTVYYRVAEIDDRIVLQYWLFYVWNSPGGLRLGARNQDNAKEFNHEGDWEGIQLVFDRSALIRALRTGDAPQPIGVGFAQHEHGTWVLSDDVQWLSDTHPTIFVADGSHASYHESGSTDLAVGDDVHRGDAPSVALAPVGLLRRTVGGEYTLRLFDESDSWTTWPGRWGKWLTRGGDGPMGPYYKAHYRTLPEEIAGWESPHNSGE